MRVVVTMKSGSSEEKSTREDHALGWRRGAKAKVAGDGFRRGRCCGQGEAEICGVGSRRCLGWGTQACRGASKLLGAANNESDVIN